MDILCKSCVLKRCIFIGLMTTVIFFPSLLLGESNDFSKAYFISRDNDSKLMLREYKVVSKKRIRHIRS